MKKLIKFISKHPILTLIIAIIVLIASIILSFRFGWWVALLGGSVGAGMSALAGSEGDIDKLRKEEKKINEKLKSGDSDHHDVSNDKHFVSKTRNK